jgi:anti-sigma factor RsiW
MHCAEFLENYSDYRDGLIEDQALLEQLSQHLLTCPHCTRYDARLARGVTVLRTLSHVDPSPGFRRQLAHRLTVSPVEAEQPIIPAPAGILVALMVVTAAALFLWHGSADAPQAEVAEQSAPAVMVVVSPGVPLVGFADFSVPALDGERPAPGAADEPASLQTAISP